MVANVKSAPLAGVLDSIMAAIESTP